MNKKMESQEKITLLSGVTDEELRAELLKRKPEAQQENKRPEYKKYPIVCSVCGKNAEVPFKPSSGSSNLKCRDCYSVGRG